ncbi:hypothetical protein MMC17_009216 [Xylographa soralifera]|nr:hypothetical protein [Xylographa soralifera]
MSDISEKSEHTQISSDDFSRIEDGSLTALPTPQNGVETDTDMPSMVKIEAAEPTESALSPPPNGGVRAWMQVLGAFFLAMNSWGIINSFGVYQTYYSTGILSSETPSNISWIGSIQAFLLLLVGIATGPIYDAGHFQILIRLGSFLTVFGLMMTSISTEYYQVMLAQGICVGLGSGCLFVPSFAIIPQYFSTRKALATGIAASGSSLGGIIYPIVFYKLQPQIGFAWATRVLGFIALAGFVVSLSVMRVRILPKQKRALLEPGAFKEIPYTFFTAGLFFSFIGLYTPIFYVQSYAIQEGITNQNLGFYLLPILNAGSVFGRILPNFVADKTGPLNMLIPCAMVASVLCFGWIGITDVPGIVVFALLYGFFSGGFVSLPPTCIMSLSPHLGVVGTRMGMCFGLTSFGILIGTPVSGALLTTTGSWKGTQVFAGATVLLALICLLVARVAKHGLKLAVKA